MEGLHKFLQFFHFEAPPPVQDVEHLAQPMTPQQQFNTMLKDMFVENSNITPETLVKDFRAVATTQYNNLDDKSKAVANKFFEIVGAHGGVTKDNAQGLLSTLTSNLAIQTASEEAGWRGGLPQTVPEATAETIEARKARVTQEFREGLRSIFASGIDDKVRASRLKNFRTPSAGYNDFGREDKKAADAIMKIVASSGGNITAANVESLIAQMTDNTDIRAAYDRAPQENPG